MYDLLDIACAAMAAPKLIELAIRACLQACDESGLRLHDPACPRWYQEWVERKGWREKERIISCVHLSGL